jgi:hypothetical protein
MEDSREHTALVDLISWIDEHTSGVTLPADERSMLAAGCFDVAIEHQAAIAVLNSSALYGSMLALLRVLSESLVRGLWLLHCATDTELHKFKQGRVDKSFDDLVTDFEAKIGTPSGVLSGFKATAWKAMNGFTHTGFIQVTRRHSLGRVGANYSKDDIAKALGVAGALGLIAAGQVIGMSDRADLIPKFTERMSSYATPASAQGDKA